MGSSSRTGKKRKLPYNYSLSHQCSQLELLNVSEKRLVVPYWVHVAEMLVFSEAVSVIHWLVFLSIAALEQVRKALSHLSPHESSSLTPFARVCLISPYVIRK